MTNGHDVSHRLAEHDLSFHGPATVVGDFESGQRLIQGHRMRDQRLHIDQSVAHPCDPGREFFVKAERASELKFFGGDTYHGEAHVAAETKLDDDSARSDRGNTRGQRRDCARAFIEDVEGSFVDVVSG